MTIFLSHAADIALRTLGEEDRREVETWIHNLEKWEQDPSVRSRAYKLDLPDTDQVYVLNTNTDLRIFFAARKNGIDVIDIARQATLDRVREAS